MTKKTGKAIVFPFQSYIHLCHLTYCIILHKSDYYPYPVMPIPLHTSGNRKDVNI